MYDRDENPVSGQNPRTVTCIGAVNVQDLLSAGALREVGDFGGWSEVVISSPGPLAALTSSGTVVTSAVRSTNVNQAIVQKLEYNTTGQFDTATFPGAFNSALWLRAGIRESVRNVATAGPNAGRTLASANANVFERATVSSALDSRGNTIDVGDDARLTTISVAQ